MSHPVFFASDSDFRDWLAQHAHSASELLVGYYKVGSGRPSMNWSDSVDQALCYGWIDGVRKRIDDEAYQIRFTPRRPGSIWSAINIAKMERLQALGWMTEAGMAAYAGRSAERSVIYAYEQAATANLLPEEWARFEADAAAWAWWQKAPPSYRKQLLHRIVSAKRPETRAKRLGDLIAACAAGVRL